MSAVIVEWTFPEPVSVEWAQDFEARQGGALASQGVRLLERHLSKDRRRMACLYDAPDAESVRRAQEETGRPFDRLWPAQIIPFAERKPDDGVVVLERTFSTPVGEARIREVAGQAEGCHEAWSCRLLSTYLAADGGRCLCIYAAPDAESVRQSQTGKLPFDRAWSSSLHRP